MVIFTPLFSILAGLVLLFTGRRVFWIAAALAAFLFLYQLLEKWLGTGLVGIIISVVIAVILATVAIRFMKLVGFIIGALAGAAALPNLLDLLNINLPWWIVAIVGAIIGIILVSIAFDWGLIIVTSWLGANVIATNIATLVDLRDSITTVIFLVLLMIGIASQAGMLRARD